MEIPVEDLKGFNEDEHDVDEDRELLRRANHIVQDLKDHIAH